MYPQNCEMLLSEERPNNNHRKCIEINLEHQVSEMRHWAVVARDIIIP